MKGVRSFALISSIALILVLVLSGCGTEQVGGGGADKEYRALNPVGVFIPVETSALSTRLDTLSGKTVYIIQGEADPIIMPALNQIVNEDYTDTTWVFYKPTSAYGLSAVDEELESNADGAIRGIGW